MVIHIHQEELELQLII